MLRRILIVDDNTVNRELLRQMLRRDYEILEAENGEEALAVMHRKHKLISAVLLDLMMPVMDGYEVLRRRRDNVALSQIPVIVTTGTEEMDAEVRALALGANDFVKKPYNPDIIRHCLRNNISLCETASIINAMQRDKLTGLYSREAFFDKVTAMLKEHEPGYYVMACFDIDNFKLINDQYGAAEGDRILREIGLAMREAMSSVGGVCSRISADNFAALFRAGQEECDLIGRTRESKLEQMDSPASITLSVGRYVVNDLSLTASAIYDRAYIAKQSVKGRYDKRAAYFDESMLEKLIREQQIVGEMDAALANGQFEVWFQPQFNHASGALIGSEALVRWRHPQRGLVSPSEFIPVFEQNGFVYELDKYVWKSSCALLRRWIDEGRSPLPVSVNVSRYDIFRADFFDVLSGYVRQYDIPVELLRLEITESAFAQSSELIIQMVKRLMEFGFTLEIDDFGSGYSSLNTLKDVPANVLKLDMRFLENDENSQRGGNILESIVRMAKWLGMSVIAEGVETVAQANFLKSIGCIYVQGYLYARPMTVEEYEKLARGIGKEEKMLALETVENMDNNAFWDPKSMDTLIFNSYIGGACIFEYCGGRMELLRANDKFVKVLGSESMTVADALRLQWEEHLDEKDRNAVRRAVERSAASGDEVTDELHFLGLPGCAAVTDLRSTLRVIAAAGERYLVYCTSDNMTAQRQAEKKEREAAAQLQTIMANINGGVTATVIKAGKPRLLFTNEQFYRQLGYTKEQFESEVRNPHDLIHPDDRARVAAETKKASEMRRPFSSVYRIIRRDGAVRWLQSNISITSLPGVKGPVQMAVANDITDLRQAEEKERRASRQVQVILNDLGSGIIATTLVDGEVEFVQANDRYYEILGYTRRQYEREIGSPYDLIRPEDRDRVRQTAVEAYQKESSAEMEYRVRRRDGAEIDVRAVLSSTRFSGVETPIQLCVFTDITEEWRARRELQETDEQIRFLNETAHSLLAQPDSNAGIDHVLEKLLNYFGGNRAYIFEFDYGSAASDNTYEVCAPGVGREKENLQRVPMEIMAYWLHAFERQSYISIADVDALEESRAEEKRVLRQQGIRSLVAVPLRREGELIGFIGIDDPSRQLSHVDRLKAIGDYLAMMLNRRDLRRKIESDHQALQRLVNDIPGGFVRMRVGADGSVAPVYFSEGFSKLVGMDWAELTALYEHDAMAGVHPDDADVVRRAVAQLIEKGEVQSEQYRLRSGEGGYIWIMFFGRRTVGDDGGIYLNVYYTDASEQNKQEEDRRELLDNMPCGAGLYELEGERLTAIHLNRRYRELVGRELGERSSERVMELVHPDDRDALLAELHLAMREGRDAESDIRVFYGKDTYRPFHVIARIVPKTADRVSLYVVYTPIRTEDGSYQQMLSVALAAMLASSSDLSFVKDRQFRYICCSRSFAALCGLSDEREIVGKTDAELTGEADAARFRAGDEAILREKTPRLDYEERLPCADGSMRYGRTSKYPLMDAGGNVIGIYAVTRDVTEYHVAFERLRLLTDTIPGGIAAFEITPAGGRMIYCNEGFYAFSGYSREEYLKRSEENPLFLLFEEDLPAVRAVVAAVRAGETKAAACTYRCHTKNGGFRWFSLKGVVSEQNGDVFMINAVQFDVTERREAEERVRISEEQYRIAASLGERTVARYDISSKIYYNDSELFFRQGFGREIPDAPEAFIAAGVVDAASVGEFRGLFEKLCRGARSAASNVLLRLAGGAPRWFRMEGTTFFDASSAPSEAILVFSDITEQREKEAVYIKWQQSLREKPPEAYTLFRCNLSKDASFDSVEGSLLQITFGEAAATFNQRTMEYAEKFVYAEDRADYIAALNSDTLLAGYYRGRRSGVLEYREIVSTEQVRWLRCTIELVEYPDSTDVEAYLMYEDIDESKRTELQTRELAESDPLTGVLNRTAFAEKTDALLRRQRNGLCALLMLDIDGFKLVNDSFGHAVGDQALVDIARTLRSILRGGDLVGRLGGDEFLVCLRDVPSRAVIGKKARQICRMLRKSFSIEVQMSASLGVAVAPEDGADFAALYHKADLALYHVKATGKDGFTFYAEEMQNEHPRPEQAEEAANTEGASASGLKRRMLIVDDNRVNRETLTRLFEGEYLIDAADNGSAALIRLRRYGAGISVVLLDLVMPEMDGFAVLEKMRGSAEMRNIPVIVVSGTDERETALRSIRCGATDFVTKPVDPALIRLRVASAVSKAENERLRAQNSYLALQSDEMARYRAVLEADGTVMAEYDADSGRFSYDPNMALHLAGSFDSRPLWEILRQDGVAEEADAARMEALLRRIEGGQHASRSVLVRLKTPLREVHRFCVKAIGRAEELRPETRVILTFTDLDAIESSETAEE